jgi:hypothetical protein
MKKNCIKCYNPFFADETWKTICKECYSKQSKQSFNEIKGERAAKMEKTKLAWGRY